MRIHSSTRYAAMAALMGALACAGNKVKSDEAAAARDTTSVRDTTQNPPGYRGMERDTTIAPTGRTPSDTFLQNQGTGQPQDTAGYSGVERVDTTGGAGQVRTDTSSYRSPTDSGAYKPQTDTSSYGRDTTGTSGIRSDTAAMDSTQRSPSSSGVGLDSTGMSKTGDTTGYNPTQQSRDTTSR